MIPSRSSVFTRRYRLVRNMLVKLLGGLCRLRIIGQGSSLCKSTETHASLLYHMYWTSVQFSHSSCPTLCDPMNCSKPGLPVHHQLLEFTQTHVHWVRDAIQWSYPPSSPSPPVPSPSQHQGLFQWVNSLHEVAKVLEFQLSHQFFQLTPSTDLL